MSEPVSKPQSECRICASEVGDASALSSLAMRSKAFWGYDETFMDLCRRELTWSEDEISATAYDFQSCFIELELVGFYALEYVGEQRAELEALFVEPRHIGAGFGHRMIEHAKERAISRGVTTIVIQGDPHAESFYLASGALSCGSRESGSVPGRRLPLFELHLKQPSENVESKNDCD